MQFVNFIHDTREQGKIQVVVEGGTVEGGRTKSSQGDGDNYWDDAP